MMRIYDYRPKTNHSSNQPIEKAGDGTSPFKEHASTYTLNNADKGAERWQQK